MVIYPLTFFHCNNFFSSFFFFFFNDTATTEIYTLSLHDALPISTCHQRCPLFSLPSWRNRWRSEEHTSELQSRRDLVCRLLLEKKKKQQIDIMTVRQNEHTNNESQSITKT